MANADKREHGVGKDGEHGEDRGPCLLSDSSSGPSTKVSSRTQALQLQELQEGTLPLRCPVGFRGSEKGVKVTALLGLSFLISLKAHAQELSSEQRLSAKA